jgi:nucleotide-binding universal stress UspA family protein
MPAGIGSLFHGTVPAAVDFTGSIVMARSGHVVCATDLSEASRAAVTVAIRLAQQRDARLHLLHVVENPFHQPWLTGAEGLDFAELLRNRIQSAEYQLGILAVTLTSVTLPPISTVVIGRPADEIVRYAQDYDADLIGDRHTRLWRHETCAARQHCQSRYAPGDMPRADCAASLDGSRVADDTSHSRSSFAGWTRSSSTSGRSRFRRTDRP